MSHKRSEGCHIRGNVRTEGGGDRQMHPPKLLMSDADVKVLNKHKIQTDEDLLCLPATTFSALHKVSAGSLVSFQKQLINRHRPVVQSAMDILYDDSMNMVVLETGCRPLDRLLKGGIWAGELTEFVGPSSIGKTQLCLTIAAHVAIVAEAGIIYIDTSRSFCASRLAGIIKQFANPSQYRNPGSTLSSALSRVIHMDALDIFEVLNILSRIKQRLEEEADNPFDKSLRLVIVDSLAAVVAPILGGASTKGHALMTEAIRMMKDIAMNHYVAFVTTNYTVSGAKDKETRPAMGESWTYFADTRVLLSEADVTDLKSHKISRIGNAVQIKKAILNKANKSAIGGSLLYHITNAGFVAVSKE